MVDPTNNNTSAQTPDESRTDSRVETTAGGWLVEDRIDAVAALHDLDIPPDVERQVWFMVPTAPALVLGSSQPDTDVDDVALADAGLDFVRRRSGGGAVLVDSSNLWVDFLIGPDDQLWDDDVGRAFGWVGALWNRVLMRVASEVPSGESFAADRLAVHDGPLERNDWNRRVCFASVGPGEVTLDGRKVVGISQRRTRAGCRFQCSVILEDRQRLVPSLLALSADDRTAARRQVEASTAGLAAPGKSVSVATTIRRVLLAELS